MQSLKITMIGAGSTSFGPTTIADILLSERLSEARVKLVLMDIAEEALAKSTRFANYFAEKLNRGISIEATTNLKEAVAGASFVITAIEKDRYRYWFQDFHLPRQYGFRQIYGENGGPGGMFHFLRNVGPMLEIAQTMEQECPDAWLLNYTNPEAKLVEAISKLTKIKVVGLCHGERMGVEQVAHFLRMSPEDLDTDVCGLNHFGWFTRITHRKTGQDLYPLLKENERIANWLANWDEYALARILFRTFGLWPYPGTNHIGEYLAWSDAYLASALLQFFYDPAADKQWQEDQIPEFIYSLSQNPTNRELFSDHRQKSDQDYVESFNVKNELHSSNEYGIPIIEAIYLNQQTKIGAVNAPNRGYVPGLLSDMTIELPALADGDGIHPMEMPPLPIAIQSMINQQGAIHELLIKAYVERSKNKLLQALLIDPTISSYNNAVALIDDLCDLQSDILPELRWE